MSTTRSCRPHFFSTMLTCLLVSASSMMTAAAADEAPKDIAVFVATLNVASGTVSGVRNITPGKGANFQPSFTGDGSAVLFVSDRAGTANIYRHVLASGETSAVTNTKESLYSPTALPDGSGFVAVRVVTADPYYGLEAKEPSLWRFGWNGKPVSPLVDTRRIGYYGAVGDQHLGLFLVDDVAARNAHKSVLMNRVTGKVTLLTNKPGKAFGRTLDGKRVTFVDQTDPKRWVICAMGPDDTQPEVLVDTAVGKAGEAESDRSQYFVGLPDGSMIMANGTRLFRWDGVKGGSFKPFADLEKLGGAIKNIAASPDGTQLAFSVAMDRVKAGIP
jgi:Tol biopolymer transport system component